MPGPWAYFDTSVLLKRYVNEAGSLAARRMLSRYDVVSSGVTPVEMTAALSRRRLIGDLTRPEFAATLGRIRGDRVFWLLLEVNPTVLARAEELARVTALRALDAIHVASCSTFQLTVEDPLAFVTADARQRRAAEHANLEVVWIE